MQEKRIRGVEVTFGEKAGEPGLENDRTRERRLGI
jgi:hypothetical protein